jgi:hypothetical protein
MKNKEPIIAWACNRCNLLTESERHPGLCQKCGCPEHRGLTGQEEDAAWKRIAKGEPSQGMEWARAKP